MFLISCSQGILFDLLAEYIHPSPSEKVVYREFLCSARIYVKREKNQTARPAEEVKAGSREPHEDLFPFPAIRKGQEDFLRDARHAVENGQHLIAHAPTGLGKTAVALSATLETALRRGLTVFFLTSKQSQHQIAIDTLLKVREKRRISAVDIISKQSMCLQEASRRLKGSFEDFCKMKIGTKTCSFYTRSNKGVVDIVSSKILHVQDVVKLCKTFGVCPHKVAMEAGLNANVIVCDYNYVFSEIRNAVLEKLKLELGDLILVVDEGHNLPDRIRGNLRGNLGLDLLRKGMKEAKELNKKAALFLLSLYRNLSKFFDRQKGERKVDPKGFVRLVNDSLSQHSALTYDKAVEWLAELGRIVTARGKASALSEIALFMKNWNSLEDSIVHIANGDEKVISYILLDPSIVSGEVFDSVFSSITMSGTMHPGEMYADLLGIRKDRRLIRSYESPFPRENRKVLAVQGLTTLFRERGSEMFRAYADLIRELADEVSGNFAIFFPSYELLQNVADCIGSSDKKRILVERQGMSKREKNELIDTMKNLQGEGGCVLLGVQGGSLSEGVDYPNNLLQLVGIAGVPISPPSIENESLREYYSRKFGSRKGYDYSYLFPAFNKVLQSAGRSIRSERDRAIVLLMDTRFQHPRYAKCFPDDFVFEKTEDPVAVSAEFTRRD